MTDSAGEDAKRAAFEAVTFPFLKSVYNRALHLTRDPDVAAELVQETYLRAFRTFANFKEGSSASAWLLTIVYSVFVSRYRKEKREPDTVALTEADFVADELSGGAASLLDPRLWASDEVHAALQRLPESSRILILMVDVDGLSYEDAAAAMQCPVGTVRSRLSRARRVLHSELIQYARSQGFGERKG
jgi:RNA polymerase sigma-70 factor (ECF subfamily)